MWQFRRRTDDDFERELEAHLAGSAVTVPVLAELTAAYLPARRATRIDPLVALRCE